MSTTYLNRPKADEKDCKPGAALPYGMTVKGVVNAINDVYAYLHAMNKASIDYGYPRLEDLMQAAGFSGLVSNIVVRSMATAFANVKPGLTGNTYPNGRPDLVPRAHYEGDCCKKGDEGIEVKASRATRGWQGHNPDGGWIMIVQMDVDAKTLPIYERRPTTILRVMVAQLEHTDWKFSGRSATSRRTPTASVTESGYVKLEAGTVYDCRPTPQPRTAPQRKPRAKKVSG